MSTPSDGQVRSKKNCTVTSQGLDKIYTGILLIMAVSNRCSHMWGLRPFGAVDWEGLGAKDPDKRHTGSRPPKGVRSSCKGTDTCEQAKAKIVLIERQLRSLRNLVWHTNDHAESIDALENAYLKCVSIINKNVESASGHQLSDRAGKRSRKTRQVTRGKPGLCRAKSIYCRLLCFVSEFLRYSQPCRCCSFSYLAWKTLKCARTTRAVELQSR